MDTTLCSNCKREVAASNFSLHEAHCWRFLSVCPLCNDPVPKEEMKEHQEKEHSQVRCKVCHEYVENCKMEEHEADECKERQMSCDFCELSLPFSVLQEHAEACGSRTELCNDCKKYIRLSDFERHKNSCSLDYKTTNGSKKVVPCQFCKKSYAEDQLFQHQDLCNPLFQYVRGSHSNPNRSLMKKHPSAVPSELPFSFHSFDKTWEYCGTNTSEVKNFPFKSRNSNVKEFSFSSRNSLNPSMTAKESKVKSNRSDKEKQLSHTFSSRRVPRIEKESNDEFGVCSQCNIMLPRQTLKEHEKKCRSLAALQNSITAIKLESQKVEAHDV
ncbi:XIAP-associated factor 1 isoform X2 [Protopterus annectens]|uniref:XIAP-associated factor 1 isoform X2 n=1 Tax=Protopterus annectens TaxID=7888 RepID=UPI001CFC0768|nr:XIAP-associated factor 1 isoform X2 [Protopterus annectens]